jgi:hypothetical protein
LVARFCRRIAGNGDWLKSEKLYPLLALAVTTVLCIFSSKGLDRVLGMKWKEE